MIVKAIFKGRNGSKGYVTNKAYSLNFKTVMFYDATIKERIEIDDSKVSGWDRNTVVQYSSLKKFLENWTLI